MANAALHVVVVGGGIGGLFAANALLAHGLKVSLYEQAPALGEVGAGAGRGSPSAPRWRVVAGFEQSF